MTIVSDIRYALRTLRKNLGLSTTMMTAFAIFAMILAAVGVCVARRHTW